MRRECLANVRKHANARRAEVIIGLRYNERFVSVRDDGEGFDGQSTAAGQGLKNIRARTENIAGGFTLTTKPGFETRPRSRPPSLAARAQATRDFERFAGRLGGVPGPTLRRAAVASDSKSSSAGTGMLRQ